MWSADAIVHAATEGLRLRAADLDAEQAVMGLDALDEKHLHPIIAQGLKSVGWGVLIEQPYPSSQLAKPQDRDRLRCDLVLTPEPGQTLVDEILLQRQRDRAGGTLFEDLASAHAHDPSALDPQNAMWLEVKVIGQYTALRGVSEPNRGYASELTRGPIADLKKLAADSRVVHAASLVVLFAESAPAAEHDLQVLAHRCLDMGVDVASPVSAGVGILNRMGNGCAVVGLIRLRVANAP